MERDRDYHCREFKYKNSNINKSTDAKRGKHYEIKHKTWSV